MKMKLISVIIPSYNCKNKLEATLLSVLNQNTNLLECIIVDGDSNDGTKEVLKKYNKKIKYISEKDKGIYDAMNKGIKLARGKYLYFLGAGDCLIDNIVNEISGILKFGKYDFVYGNIRVKSTGKIYNGKYNKVKILFGNICHQAIFYKSTLFKLYGKYNLKYKAAADYELNIKCFGNNKVNKYYLDKIICLYECNGFSFKYAEKAFNKDINYIIKENMGKIYYIIRKIFFIWVESLRMTD